MSTGEEIRLARLFDGGPNAVVAAIDHGLYNGPRPGFEDLAADRRPARGRRRDPHQPRHGRPRRARPSAPRRAGDDRPPQLGHPVRDPVGLPREPERADDLGRRSRRPRRRHRPRRDVDQDRLRGRRRRERRGGRALRRPRSARPACPIVGEVYPAGHEDIAPEERHEVISIGCRIVAELGVDLVKTFHTGERFAEIVRSTPVPDPGPRGEEAAPRDATRSSSRRRRVAVRSPRRRLRPQPDPGPEPGTVPRRAPGRRQARRRPGRGGREARHRADAGRRSARDAPRRPRHRDDLGQGGRVRRRRAAAGRRRRGVPRSTTRRPTAPSSTPRRYWAAPRRGASGARSERGRRGPGRRRRDRRLQPGRDRHPRGRSTAARSGRPSSGSTTGRGPRRASWPGASTTPLGLRPDRRPGRQPDLDRLQAPVVAAPRARPCSRAAARFLLVEDFLLHRLTGRFVTEGGVQCTIAPVRHPGRRLVGRRCSTPSAIDAERLPELVRPGRRGRAA